MNNKSLRYIFIPITLLLFTCIKPEREMMVTTGVVRSRTYNSASVSGILIDMGEGVTHYGHCYAKTPDVTINDLLTTLGTPKDAGDYTSLLSNLDPGTVYYVKAYVSNDKETIYGEEISFVTVTETVTDVDGNIYNIAEIGTQKWMKENLRTTKYNNGISIPAVTDNTAWSNLITPGYCWFNNDETNYKEKYGALYNWYAVTTGSLCPAGWHTPSETEWTILINYLGGLTIAGGKLKEPGFSHWVNPNSEATNESGFTALPGGFRDYVSGPFFSDGAYGVWWTSTVTSPQNTARYYRMSYDSYDVTRAESSLKYGFSVRCIKD